MIAATGDEWGFAIAFTFCAVLCLVPVSWRRQFCESMRVAGGLAFCTIGGIGIAAAVALTFLGRMVTAA